MADVVDASRKTGLRSLPSDLHSDLLLSLFVQSPHGLAFVDADLVIRAANETCARQAGVPLGRLIGRGVEEGFPGWREQMGAICRQVRESGQSTIVEARPHEPAAQRGGGGWELTISPVQDPAGAFEGWLLQQRTATGRKRAEEALRKAREELEIRVQERTAELEKAVEALGAERRRFNEVLDVLPAYVVLLTPDHHVPFANRLFRERFGESHGRRCFEHLFGRSEPCENCDTYKVLETMAPLEWEWIGPDGRNYTIFDYPFADVDGSTLILEMGMDITERKRVEEEIRKLNVELEQRVMERTRELSRANEQLQQEIAERKRTEEALRESERRWATTLASIGDAVIATDAVGRITFMNAVAEALSGWTLREALQRPVQEVFSIVNEQTRQRVDDPVGRVLEEGVVVGLANHTVLVRRDGAQVAIDDSGAPIRDQDGKTMGVVLVFRDITGRKQAEAERERLLAAEQEARQQAEAAVRQRDEFVSVAAHELKTPLTSLRGFAQVLQRQLQKSRKLDPTRVAQAAAQIDRQSARLARLVNQLLDLSRIEAGKLILDKEVADIPAVVEGVADTLRRLHPGREIVVVGQGPAPAMVDRLRLEQVVTNLLDNACKFSPEDTPIEVEVGRQAAEAVRIVVRDHGIGIPAEKRGRLFERFYQAHEGEWRGGMGLGLYISRQIVELHGGSIAVECPADGGSRFTVLLPLGGD